MGRKTQITKEAMLEAAYEILENAGYGAVNIKTIAARVGCSTQPISWQFGNMQGLRRELYAFVAGKVWGGMENLLTEKNAMEAFFETGKIYLSCAYDKPNVFKFLCVDDPGDIFEWNCSIVELFGNEPIKVMLAKELGLSREIVDRIVADIIIYTHGLATIILWDAINITKEEAYEMIFNHANTYFSQYGINAREYVNYKPKLRI